MPPALLLLWLLGCGTLQEEVRHADLQLDIRGADWHDEDRARVCVAGVGIVESALSDGKLAFTGIPLDDTPREVSVDLLVDGQENASAGAISGVTLSLDTPWQTVDWSPCPSSSSEDCRACTTSGERAPAGEASLLLAVRFL